MLEHRLWIRGKGYPENVTWPPVLSIGLAPVLFSVQTRPLLARMAESRWCAERALRCACAQELAHNPDPSVNSSLPTAISPGQMCGRAFPMPMQCSPARRSPKAAEGSKL
jgi:hypothetical protein